MKFEVSGIFLTIVWSISYIIHEISSDKCVYVSGNGNESLNTPFLILNLSNGMRHEVRFGENENLPAVNVSCTISILPDDFCATPELNTQNRAALHTSFVVTTSLAVTTSLNAENSSVSTQRGYDQLNKTLFESSFGAALAGLVFGIIITSTACLIRERLQIQKNKAVYTQNHYEPPNQDIQMTDVYNEISDERNSRVVQETTLTIEQRHSSMKSNLSCGVYNHLHESPVVSRDNNYEHVHLSKTEGPAPGNCDGAIDGVPHPHKSSDRDEMVDNNDFLFRKEDFEIPESDGLKTNDNYFVLEKSLFTKKI